MLEVQEAEAEECKVETSLGYVVSLDKEQQKTKSCGSCLRPQHTRG